MPVFTDHTTDAEPCAPERTPRPTAELPKLRAHVRGGGQGARDSLQIVRFGVVGATGYAVNLLVFALCLHLLAVDYRLSAAIAWTVSVLNNFWLNRHWTFRTDETRVLVQGVRFFVVSAFVFGFAYLILVALVSDADVPKVTAQAVAIVAGMPLNYAGQKLWTFSRKPARRR